MATRRGKHEGSIYLMSNGTWRAQVTIGKKRIGCIAKSKAECRDWVRERLNEIDKGMTFERHNITLAEYLKGWMSEKKNAVRIKTGFQYQRLINLYIEPNIGNIKLKDLNLHIVGHFYESLKERGVGVSNIRYSHRVLHCALEQALKDGLIIRNPSHGATVPRAIHKEMKILNDEQVNLFLVAASGSRYQALYHLAVTTGMRISELRGLCWSDIDWIKSTIKVNRQIQDIPGKGTMSGAPKTYSGIRTILLGETSLNMLREQNQRIEAEASRAGDSWKHNDLIFPSNMGTPFSDANVRKDFVAVLKAANIPRIRFHDLRHTAASLMLNHGVPALVVSKILGHSSPSVTLNIYAHSTIDMQSIAAGIMDKIVSPTPINVSQLHSTAHGCTR